MSDNWKTRRSSILKPPKTRNPLSDVDLCSHADITLMSKSRRVSFANNNFIKEFTADPEKNTIWHNSYEESLNKSDHSTDMKLPKSVPLDELDNDPTADVSFAEPDPFNCTTIGNFDTSLEVPLTGSPLDTSYASTNMEFTAPLPIENVVLIPWDANLEEFSEIKNASPKDSSVEFTKGVPADIQIVTAVKENVCGNFKGIQASTIKVSSTMMPEQETYVRIMEKGGKSVVHQQITPYPASRVENCSIMKEGKISSQKVQTRGTYSQPFFTMRDENICNSSMDSDKENRPITFVKDRHTTLCKDIAATAGKNSGAKRQTILFNPDLTEATMEMSIMHMNAQFLTKEETRVKGCGEKSKRRTVLCSEYGNMEITQSVPSNVCFVAEENVVNFKQVTNQPDIENLYQFSTENNLQHGKLQFEQSVSNTGRIKAKTTEARRETAHFDPNSTDGKMEITKSVPASVLQAIKQNVVDNRYTESYDPRLEDSSKGKIPGNLAEGSELITNTGKRQTVLYQQESEDAGMEMTTALPANLLKSAKVRRGTTHFDPDSTSGCMETTTEIPVNLLENTKFNAAAAKRRTVHYNQESEDAGMELTTELPASLLKATKLRRGTVNFDPDSSGGCMDTTEMLVNIEENSKFNAVTAKRRTVHYNQESEDAGMEITTAVSVNLLKNIKVRRETAHFDPNSTDYNMEITKSVPARFLKNLQAKRQKMVNDYILSGCNPNLSNDNVQEMSDNLAESTKFVADTEKRQTVTYNKEHEDAGMEMTTALPINLLENAKARRDTANFDPNATGSYMETTKGVPPNFVENMKSTDAIGKRRTVHYNQESEDADMELTTELPATLFKTTTVRRETAHFDPDSADCSIEITKSVPADLLQNIKAKRQTDCYNPSAENGLINFPETVPAAHNKMEAAKSVSAHILEKPRCLFKAQSEEAYIDVQISNPSVALQESHTSKIERKSISHDQSSKYASTTPTNIIDSVPNIPLDEHSGSRTRKQTTLYDQNSEDNITASNDPTVEEPRGKVLYTKVKKCDVVKNSQETPVTKTGQETRSGCKRQKDVTGQQTANFHQVEEGDNIESMQINSINVYRQSYGKKQKLAHEENKVADYDAGGKRVEVSMNSLETNSTNVCGESLRHKKLASKEGNYKGEGNMDSIQTSSTNVVGGNLMHKMDKLFRAEDKVVEVSLPIAQHSEVESCNSDAGSRKGEEAMMDSRQINPTSLAKESLKSKKQKLARTANKVSEIPMLETKPSGAEPRKGKEEEVQLNSIQANSAKVHDETSGLRNQKLIQEEVKVAEISVLEPQLSEVEPCYEGAESYKVVKIVSTLVKSSTERGNRASFVNNTEIGEITNISLTGNFVGKSTPHFEENCLDFSSVNEDICQRIPHSNQSTCTSPSSSKINITDKLNAILPLSTQKVNMSDNFTKNLSSFVDNTEQLINYKCPKIINEPVELLSRKNSDVFVGENELDSTPDISGCHLVDNKPHLAHSNPILDKPDFSSLHENINISNCNHVGSDSDEGENKNIQVQSCKKLQSSAEVLDGIILERNLDNSESSQSVTEVVEPAIEVITLDSTGCEEAGEQNSFATFVEKSQIFTNTLVSEDISLVNSFNSEGDSCKNPEKIDDTITINDTSDDFKQLEAVDLQDILKKIAKMRPAIGIQHTFSETAKLRRKSLENLMRTESAEEVLDKVRRNMQTQNPDLEKRKKESVEKRQKCRQMGKRFEETFSKKTENPGEGSEKMKLEDKLRLKSKELWNLNSIISDQFIFRFMFNTIEFHVNVDQNTEVVKGIKFFRRFCESKSDPIAVFVHSILREKLTESHIKSACVQNYTILFLLDYITMIGEEMVEILNEFDRLKMQHGVVFDSSFNATFRSISFSLRMAFRVTVNLSDWNNITKDCITITPVVGKVAENAVKNLAKGCPPGLPFLKNYILSVKEYVKIQEKYRS